MYQQVQQKSGIEKRMMVVCICIIFQKSGIEKRMMAVSMYHLFLLYEGTSYIFNSDSFTISSFNTKPIIRRLAGYLSDGIDRALI